MKKDSGLMYYFLILGLLLIISFPGLFFPPVSDYQEMFYFFHHLDEKPGPIKWLHVLNRDPFESMRYQPLSHLFHYIIHRIFGSTYIIYNVVNFLLYFLSIILLYRFSLYFIKNNLLVKFFFILFAFFFSHFDILLWSLHLYIIFGFIIFISGFVFYIKFLKTNKIYLIFLSGLFFVMGMWCYEAFFFWPLAIIILSMLKRIDRFKILTKKRIIKVNSFILASVYGLYYIFYLFTRSLGTYQSPTYQFLDFFKLKKIIASGALVFFNFLYTHLIVNIYPFIAFPLKVTENIYMSGPIIEYVQTNFGIVFLVAVSIIVVLMGIGFILFKKKYYEEIKILSLFLFLSFSFLYTLVFCRFVGGVSIFPITNFRYQYIPNAFFILIVVYIINRFIVFSKIRKTIAYLILVVIFSFNVYCIYRVVNIRKNQFNNLSKMLFSIRLNIKEGKINGYDKLYIDENITDYFPGLCWNIQMGERFIKYGKYRWMFSEKEIEYFVDNLKEASWIIDRENFNVVQKAIKNINKKGEKVSVGKLEQYMALGHFYKGQQRFKEAEEAFKKAIEMNHHKPNPYYFLGICYIKQEKYEEAEKIFRQAIEINPKSYLLYLGLGHCYIGQRNYRKAENIFKKLIKLEPEKHEAYIGLWIIYNDQGEYKKAQKMLDKALGRKQKKSKIFF